MKRKLLAIIALSLFVVVSVTACGGDGEELTPEQQQQDENPSIAI
jgi:hypothetical protein